MIVEGTESLYLFIVLGLCGILFWSIPKIFAWLLYDTKVEAKCCDKFIEAKHRHLDVVTFLSYIYNEEKYTTTLFILFSSVGKKYKIKIRSDKPNKAVSFHEFIFGLITLLAYIWFVCFMFFYMLLSL